jgi:hypothetical protein
MAGIALAGKWLAAVAALCNSPLFLCPIVSSSALRSARVRILFEENQMKRVELSDISSNVLLLSSVMVALTPLLLGDRLVLLAQNGLTELSIFINEMSTFVMKALS